MKKILLIVTPVMLSSCYSYHLFPREYRDFEYNGEKKTAFVVNPELKKEYKILKASGIFILTSDSLDQNCLKIKLNPVRRNFVCGQPIIASAFTLGQFPVYFPDIYLYGFEELNNNGTISRDFKLEVSQRVWFWDMFAFNKKFKQKAGKALLCNYYKE